MLQCKSLYPTFIIHIINCKKCESLGTSHLKPWGSSIANLCHHKGTQMLVSLSTV